MTQSRFQQLKAKVALLTVAVFFGWASTASATLNVVTTTEDIASLARQIGGGHVEVMSLTRGYQDAHFMQAKPSLMVRMHSADLLIYQGLELEVGWLPLLIQGARNPKIFLGQPGHLDMSIAIDPIQVPEGPLDRSMGDVHPFGNPHYTLDPSNIKPMAYLLADHLSKLDPGHATEYKANRDRFVKTFEAHHARWKEIMKPYRGKKLVTYHRTWDYFLQHFGLVSIGTVETKPGVQPTPAHLAELAETMKAQKVKLILQANYYRLRFSELLADKTGATLLSLPPAVGGVPETKDTIEFFEYLVKRITEALKMDE